MDEFSRLLELSGIKAPTIVSATERSGNINRKAANKMVDPKGWFQKNKDKNYGGKGSYYEGKTLKDYMVEANADLEPPASRDQILADILDIIKTNVQASPSMIWRDIKSIYPDENERYLLHLALSIEDEFPDEIGINDGWFIYKKEPLPPHMRLNRVDPSGRWPTSRK